MVTALTPNQMADQNAKNDSTKAFNALADAAKVTGISYNATQYQPPAAPAAPAAPTYTPQNRTDGNGQAYKVQLPSAPPVTPPPAPPAPPALPGAAPTNTGIRTGADGSVLAPSAAGSTAGGANAAYGALLTAPAADPNTIRQQMRDNIQGQIDGINNTYAGIISKATNAATNATGSVRAVAGRGGTLGSDFGNSEVQQASDNGDAVVKGYKEEQAAKINALLQGVDERSSAAINAANEKKLGNAKDYADFVQNQQTNARQDLVNFAKSGHSLDSLSDTDYQALLDQTGYTQSQLSAISALNKPQDQILTSFTQGNKYYVVSQDPVTKQKKTETVDLGFTPPTNYEVQKVGTTGLFFFDPKNPEKNHYIYNVAPTPGSTTTLTTVPGASSELVSAIAAGKIKSTWVNSKTLALYNDLAKAGVDVAASNGGITGKTSALTDAQKIETTARRTLGTLDANMPLLINLADKVNATGIPALDSYLTGNKLYSGNDPDIGRYVNTIKTLRSEYASMLSKGSVASESDKHEAADAIPTGKDSSFYKALQNQLDLEANNIIDTAQSVKQGIFSSSDTGDDETTALKAGGYSPEQIQQLQGGDSSDDAALTAQGYSPEQIQQLKNAK